MSDTTTLIAALENAPGIEGLVIAAAVEREGGFTERLYRVRTENRSGKSNRST